MTPIETHPVDAADAQRSVHQRSKGVLFCPACGHESPVGGDWHVELTGDTRTRRCPDCRTVVSDR
ncbi:hypothetical protein [Haloarcula sp. JP-L23]|uniref:hypothetical protein n=1 Tax=Haloarcula sp. JP-L23 TaxID=2716717 RepID=UPI00140F3E35|nr:hypothetical protein G9465_13075 [Haloarcula sp. JP-L23]